MSLSSYVDEWLCIMYKLGFIDPEFNPHIHPTPRDEYRTAKIFSVWIGSARTNKDARKNSIALGHIIHSRATFKGLDFGQVHKVLEDLGNFYMKILEDIDTEVKGEEDDVKLGRERGKTEGEREERRKEEKVAKLMFVIATNAERTMLEIGREGELKAMREGGYL